MSEIFHKYYLGLVKLLPMNDSLFSANLYGKKLLPGDLKANIQSLSTSADKATKFLDAVIEPAINNGDIRQFKLLLSIMSDSDNSSVKSLAEEIIDTLKDIHLGDQTGKYIIMQSYSILCNCHKVVKVI